MLFSVLIANYNNAQFLGEALTSVLDQEYSDWELVIVDDASTDQSPRILQELDREPKIRIFYNDENRGCGYTKRLCVDKASGSVCGFLDSDDVLAPEALAVMAKQHAKFEEAGLIYSKYQLCNSELKPMYVPEWIGEFEEGETQLTDTRISHFATFKKKAYNRTPGINPELKRAVDQDLYLKLEEVADTKFVDQILYYYRKHGRGISTFENRYKAKYWHLLACFDACERRGISKEEFFSDFLKHHDSAHSLKQTKEYQVGSFLLKPFRKIYSYFD